MTHRHTGLVFQATGALVAAVGSVPLVLLSHPWRSAKTATPLDAIYEDAHLLQAALAALGGLAVGYVLFRVGRHLRAKTTLPGTPPQKPS